MDENAIRARITAIDKTLAELKEQWERGQVELGQYTRLKTDLERQKAELEAQLKQRPKVRTSSTSSTRGKRRAATKQRTTPKKQHPVPSSLQSDATRSRQRRSLLFLLVGFVISVILFATFFKQIQCLVAYQLDSPAFKLLKYLVPVTAVLLLIVFGGNLVIEFIRVRRFIAGEKAKLPSLSHTTIDILSVVAGVVLALIGCMILGALSPPSREECFPTPVPPASAITPVSTTPASSTPTLTSMLQQLIVTVSNERLGRTDSTVVMVTESSPPLDLIPVKGGAPVTVTIQALDQDGNTIPPGTLSYHWELCCYDPKNTPPGDTQSHTWLFRPPTDLLTETLSIRVSGQAGFNITAVIPFTITIR